MSRIHGLLFALAMLLAPFHSASAQSVLQSGVITPSHVPYWVSNGVVGDGGTANDSPITTLGVTSNSAAGFCVSSGRQTAAGRQQLCFGAPLSGNAKISLQNYGTAVAQGLDFVINGTVISIPTGGGTVPTITTPLVNNNLICADGTSGALKGCTTGTAGQILIGQGALAPSWATLSGDVLSVSAGGLVTLSGVHGVTYPSSPTIGTAPYVSSANTITYGSVPPTGGGTGLATITANGVMIGNGTSPVTTASTADVGLCLLSNGLGTPPSFQSCAAGAGSAGGANTQVQFNNFSTLAGSPNFTWVSPVLTIGQNATDTGAVALANGGALGATVTIRNNSATSAYFFNLPASAGTSGLPLLSAGGGSAPMTFGALGVAGGGTGCTTPTGTCLDNITGFSSTGYINRTGAGTYAFSTTIGLINGGTGANLTASNGGIVYSTASAMAILSGTATAGQIVRSGSSAAPSWSTATYPATTTANQLLYSSATNTIGGLSSAANGVLVTDGSSVPSIGSTLPSAVQGNITTVGTISSGTWQGTNIALNKGGTNASLTASNGGIFYSTGSAGAILSGTATANLPLLSGSSTTPSWATISYPASATSGGIPYFSSSTAISSSAALGSGQVVLGGGTGSAPTTSANASISSGALTLGQVGSVGGSIVLSGATSGTATIRVAAAAGTATIFQLPATNGVASQVLQTDGSGNTSWVAAAGGGTVTSVSAGTGMSFTTITSSGAVAIDGATAGNFEAGTANKVLTADVVFTAETTTTYGTTTTLDFSTFLNTRVTLTGNITTLNCSNMKAGQSGTVTFVQDGTGSRTMVAGWCSVFRWAGGTRGVLSTAINAIDALFYNCISTTVCYVSLGKAQAN